jgi:NAD(P)-dependent dehydrogenase (short-subunit alcohol dehydrogenase family)
MNTSRPVAVVTGAGGGIGASISRRLASTYDLILNHLHDDARVQAAADEARHLGATIEVIAGDLTRPETIASLRRAADTASGRVAALVSNAGAYPRIAWQQHDVETFQRQIQVNLVSHAAVVQALTEHLTAEPAGRIVAVSSVLSQLGRVDLAGYIAAKSGLEGLVRALARELGPHGVTVNAIRAGSIEVPAEHDVVPDHAAMVQRQLDRQSIKRRGTPADVAGAVSYLLSADASFITGQCLNVDGGWHLS